MITANIAAGTGHKLNFSGFSFDISHLGKRFDNEARFGVPLSKLELD